MLLKSGGAVCSSSWGDLLSLTGSTLVLSAAAETALRLLFEAAREPFAAAPPIADSACDSSLFGALRLLPLSAPVDPIPAASPESIRARLAVTLRTADVGPGEGSTSAASRWAPVGAAGPISVPPSPPVDVSVAEPVTRADRRLPTHLRTGAADAGLPAAPPAPTDSSDTTWFDVPASVATAAAAPADRMMTLRGPAGAAPVLVSELFDAPVAATWDGEASNGSGLMMMSIPYSFAIRFSISMPCCRHMARARSDCIDLGAADRVGMTSPSSSSVSDPSAYMRSRNVPFEDFPPDLLP